MMLVIATSKVPFYIAGGVLALWAVALSGIGINRSTFPGGAVGERAVALISLVLAALAIAMAIVTA
jgi:hypothetical protein